MSFCFSSFYYIKGTEPKTTALDAKNLKLNDISIELNNGAVTIKIDAQNAKNIKIIKEYNGKKESVYNGELKNQIKENLKYFGTYLYTVEITDLNENVTTKILPKVNYQNSNLDILDEDWWYD